MICRFFRWSGCGSILDLGCGNGFLACLLSGEGLQVCGVDIEEFSRDFLFEYRECLFEESEAGARSYGERDDEGALMGDCFYREGKMGGKSGVNPRFIQMDAGDIPPGTFDGVFLSWPDQGRNKASMVLRQNPLAVVYVIETTGLTGDREGRYILDLLHLYRPIIYWDNVNHRDLESAIFHRESGLNDFPESAHNRVILFLRRDAEMEGFRDFIEFCTAGFHEALEHYPSQFLKPYPWEKELDEIFPVGKQVNCGGKILWKPVPVVDEARFLKEFSRENTHMKGIVL